MQITEQRRVRHSLVPARRAHDDEPHPENSQRDADHRRAPTRVRFRGAGR